MIVTTTEAVAQKKLVRTLGVVRGNSVRSRHLGKDILALFRNVVGGEIPEYTKLAAEAREQALDRMIEEAEELGANAVVAIRYGTAMLMSGAAELLVYGTAVIIE
ncbi:MAG: YbjQ family protein [Acidobacteriota bacterium]